MEKAPSIVFIVPYRNRVMQKYFFYNHMTRTVLKDFEEDSYRIYFVHQQDDLPFNRGAMKNIGFLAIREKYPNDYHNITFVFNDVDTMPYIKDFFDYKTVPGIVKHFYGFQFALGGIVSICGKDFEKVNGFPNFWAWGYEDNELNKRVSRENILIDRTTFYSILDSNVIHLQDGFIRNINAKEKERYKWSTSEGFQDIKELEYNIEENMIQVTQYKTKYIPDGKIIEQDLRKPSEITKKKEMFMRFS